MLRVDNKAKIVPIHSDGRYLSFISHIFPLSSRRAVEEYCVCWGRKKQKRQKYVRNDHLRRAFGHIVKSHTIYTASTRSQSTPSQVSTGSIVNRDTLPTRYTLHLKKAPIHYRSTSHPRDHAHTAQPDIREKWQKEKCTINTASPP